MYTGKINKTYKPSCTPVPNPRRNAKHGCLERQSEENLSEESMKGRCNTLRVEGQKVKGGSTAHVAEGRQKRCGYSRIGGRARGGGYL